MNCPACGHENIDGIDRCENCLAPFRQLDIPSADGAEGLARSVMEDDLRELDQEILEVTSDTPAIEAVLKMRTSRVGCALVVDNGKLVGIFTERDVLNKLAGKTAQADTTAVKELMSPNPESLRETDSVATALSKMSLGRYRHIPVLKADGSYSVTSIKHLLKYIAKEER